MMFRRIVSILPGFKAETDLDAPGAGQAIKKTGLEALDHVMTDLPRGSLIVLGGRPAMGTSALSFQLAAHIAFEKKQPALLFSMDMSASQAVARMVVQRRWFETGWLRKRHLPANAAGKLDSIYASMCEAPLYIDDSPALKPSQILDRVESLYYEHAMKLGMIVIDSLQCISPLYDEDCSSRDCDKVLSLLRQMAQELQVPVLVTTSLHRRLERRKDKRPRISDLPHAGIAQIADMLILLYRCNYYALGESCGDCEGLAELNVCRNRFGSGGTILLKYVAEHMLYMDLD